MKQEIKPIPLKELKSFLTEDEILSCLTLFENRQMDAAKELSDMMYYRKYSITTLMAHASLKAIYETM